MQQEKAKQQQQQQKESAGLHLMNQTVPLKKDDLSIMVGGGGQPAKDEQRQPQEQQNTQPAHSNNKPTLSNNMNASVDNANPHTGIIGEKPIIVGP